MLDVKVNISRVSISMQYISSLSYSLLILHVRSALLCKTITVRIEKNLRLVEIQKENE